MKKPRYAPCFWCEKTDSPQHKEDVIPKWVARDLAAAAGVPSEYEARTGKLADPEWPSRQYGAKNKLGWETKGPCQRCNNTWMSDLETQARPVLLPLMTGTPSPIEVDGSSALIMARWALKTTILYEYLHFVSNRFFSRTDRRDFFTDRSIPPDTFIYAARSLAGTATHSIGGPVTVHFPGSTTKVRAYCATMAIGQLVFQVFAFKRPEVGSERLHITIPARWDDAHRPVWPLAPTGWTWPPRVVIVNNDELIAFAQRAVHSVNP